MATDYTEHKTKGARTYKRRSWSRKKPEVKMAGLLLLKARSEFMASIMYLNSLVLRHGGANKRCIERFNRLGVCVNHSATLKMLG